MDSDLLCWLDNEDFGFRVCLMLHYRSVGLLTVRFNGNGAECAAHNHYRKLPNPYNPLKYH